jgi:drug/metabolite transporter (DMT)-like permease
MPCIGAVVRTVLARFMTSSKSFPAIPFLALLAGGIAIGFAGIFMRLSDVNPVASAFWRMALALPVLWLWALAASGTDRSDGKRADFSPMLALAGFYFAVDMGVWHLSLHYTTVAKATLIPNSAPILIALWMWFVHRVRFARMFIVGMAIAVIGVVLLVGAQAGGEHGNGANGSEMLGDALALGAAVFYAAYQLAVKDARDQYSAVRLMAWSTTVTAIALLPAALLAPGPFWPAQPSGWLPLIALALVAQITGQTVIAYAFAHLPASLSSVSLLIQPLTAAIVAWLLFAEKIGPLQIAGGVMLLFGIYLSKRGSRL